MGRFTIDSNMACLACFLVVNLFVICLRVHDKEMITMTVQSDWAVLTDEKRQFFEDNGYLMIEDALPPDVVAELNAAD